MLSKAPLFSLHTKIIAFHTIVFDVQWLQLTWLHVCGNQSVAWTSYTLVIIFLSIHKLDCFVNQLNLPFNAPLPLLWRILLLSSRMRGASLKLWRPTKMKKCWIIHAYWVWCLYPKIDQAPFNLRLAQIKPWNAPWRKSSARKTEAAKSLGYNTYTRACCLFLAQGNYIYNVYGDWFSLSAHECKCGICRWLKKDTIFSVACPCLHIQRQLGKWGTCTDFPFLSALAPYISTRGLRVDHKLWWCWKYNDL